MPEGWREERTLEEEFADSAITLVAALRARRAGVQMDRLHFMKILYLTEQRLVEQGGCGTHFGFFRYEYGPMSRRVYETWDRLKRAGLLDERETFDLTERGAEVAEELDALLRGENNAALSAAVDQAVAFVLPHRSFEHIVNAIYELVVRPIYSPTARRIGDLSYGEQLTAIPQRPTDYDFVLDPSWAETMAILLSPENRLRLLDAQESATSGGLRRGDISGVLQG